MKLFDQMVLQINAIVYVSGVSGEKFLSIRDDCQCVYLENIYIFDTKKSINCEKWEISANSTVKII